MNILLIINPVSGRQKSPALMFSVVNFLTQNNCVTTAFTTTHPGHATTIVETHASRHSRIICCGGDGTLNEVLSGLAHLDPPIPVGYIPTGTTNDLAHAIGLASNIKRAMFLSLFGKMRTLDLGVFNLGEGSNRYFSYVASFGAFSNVAYETPQWLKNRLGRASYFFYGLSEIADIKGRQVKVVADDTVIEGDFVYGSVSNSTIIGGMVKLPEDAIQLDDGKFEVMLIKTPKTPLDLHQIIQQLANQSYNGDAVLFFTAGQVDFIFEETTPWTVDGEFAGGSKAVSISNMQKKIQVMVDGGSI